MILARENDTKELWIQAHEILHTTGGGGEDSGTRCRQIELQIVFTDSVFYF